MSKKVTTFDFTGVSDAQVFAVKAVLAEAQKHTYSVSRVYGAYNAVMGTNDDPQSCPSCLRSRVKELQDWDRAFEANLTAGADKGAKATKDAAPKDKPVLTQSAAKDKAPKYIETFIVIDGERHAVLDDNDKVATVVFTPSAPGAAFGKATDVNGKPAPAFVYEQNGIAYLVNNDGNYTEVTGEPIAQVTAAQYTDAGAKGYVAPGEGVTRLMQPDGVEGLPIDFTPGDDLAAPHKGSVKYADGSTVKPGKHLTADGSTIGVQPGGKATITVAEDLT